MIIALRRDLSVAGRDARRLRAGYPLSVRRAEDAVRREALHELLRAALIHVHAVRKIFDRSAGVDVVQDGEVHAFCHGAHDLGDVRDAAGRFVWRDEQSHGDAAAAEHPDGALERVQAFRPDRELPVARGSGEELGGDRRVVDPVLIGAAQIDHGAKEELAVVAEEPKHSAEAGRARMRFRIERSETGGVICVRTKLGLQVRGHDEVGDLDEDDARRWIAIDVVRQQGFGDARRHRVIRQVQNWLARQVFDRRPIERVHAPRVAHDDDGGIVAAAIDAREAELTPQQRAIEQHGKDAIAGEHDRDQGRHPHCCSPQLIHLRIGSR